MCQRRRPIFQRVSNVLKVSILRRPIIPRLKLPRKQRISAKRVKLLQQYNCKFLQESQVSPLRTSVISYRRKRNRISKLGLKHIYSLLFLSRCIGRSSDDHIVDTTITHNWMEMEHLHCVDGVSSPSWEISQPFAYFSEDDSIDLKAERFIKKFYDEMRLQKREFTC